MSRCAGLIEQDCLDVLADVEPAASDLAARQDASACPIFDGADWGVQQDGDLWGRHHVVSREACRRRFSV